MSAFGRRASLLRFAPADLVAIGGVEHVYERAVEGGHVLRRHGSPIETSVTDAEMARFANVADFLHVRGHYREEGAFARERSGVGRLADLPGEELPEVMWRLWWVEAALKAEAEGYEDPSVQVSDGKSGECSDDDGAEPRPKRTLTRSDESMKAFIGATEAAASRSRYARVDGTGAAGKRRAGTVRLTRDPPKPSTLRRWISIYEKGGCRAHALRTRYRLCGNRTVRLEPETYAEVTRIAAGYASPKRPTVTKLHADLEIALRALNGKRAGQGLPPLALPSIKVLRKAVEALRRSPPTPRVAGCRRRASASCWSRARSSPSAPASASRWTNGRRTSS